MSNHRSDFLVFASPDIQNAEIDEVVACLKSGWLGTGPRTKAFEDQFARYKGVSSAVALNSCTAGLFLALRALGVGPGDEVITTALTFCATVNSILHTGATPVLVDVDPETMNISAVKIKEKITNRTKCIIPVHFAGRPCDMSLIMELAKSHGLYVVEDCAHSIEASINGVSVGSIGDVGCFSFYVTKNVVTGEGGMIIAKNKEVERVIRIQSLHGISHDAWNRFGSHGYKHYEIEMPGYKFNMMDIQAAIGIHQLKRVDESWKKRQLIWDIYNEELRDLPITLPSKVPAGIRHAYHLYTILVNSDAGISRDNFLQRMSKKNIGTGVHYRSLPDYEFYRRTLGWKVKDYPEAFRIGQQTVSLPLTPKLTENDVDSVIQAVKDSFTK